MTKLIALIFILSGVGLGFSGAYRTWQSKDPRYANQNFMAGWERDLQKLEKTKFLHPGFRNLQKILLISPSERLKNIYATKPLNLQTHDNGKFSLEIFMDEVAGGGVVVQYDLIDMHTGNTVWELGRTFSYNVGK
ncbi:MAG: hypothetical protein SGI74_13065 [Oligoflexia bacterium]|nr:hypothetical protein [Oligoflexia bacterium]